MNAELVIEYETGTTCLLYPTLEREQHFRVMIVWNKSDDELSDLPDEYRRADPIGFVYILN